VAGSWLKVEQLEIVVIAMTEEVSIEARLQEPFEPNDIKWRVQQSGVKNGRVWMIVLPYITGRAIQKRLDDVFGVFGWEVKQEPIFGPRPNISINADVIGPKKLEELLSESRKPSEQDGFLCTVRVFDKSKNVWVTRQDVAPMTDIEPLKGGSSGALKRAGAMLGIGRYLYQLKSGFANCVPCDSQREAVNNYAYVRDKANPGSGYGVDWTPPALPDWALPGLDTDKFISDIRKAASHLELTTAFDDAYRWASSFSKLDLMQQFKLERDSRLNELKQEAADNVQKNEKDVSDWLDQKIKNIEAVGYVGAVTNVSNQILNELMSKCEGQLFDKKQFQQRLKTAVDSRIKTLEGK